MIEKYALLKIMREVLLNANEKYSVRAAADRSGVSVFAAKHGLDYLYGKDMITLEKIGRTYQYKANLDSYLTREWKRLFSLEEIDTAGVVSAIRRQSEKIFNIVLYGSVAEGRDDALSDIDMLVIAEVDRETKKRILLCAKGTSREINITVYTPAEWRRKANSEKAFYDSAVINSVALYGEKPVVL